MWIFAAAGESWRGLIFWNTVKLFFPAEVARVEEVVVIAWQHHGVEANALQGSLSKRGT